MKTVINILLLGVLVFTSCLAVASEISEESYDKVMLQGIAITDTSTEAPHIYDYFRGGDVRRGLLSPNGQLVSFHYRNKVVIGRPDIGFFELLDLKRHLYFHGQTWIDDDDLLLNGWDAKRQQYFHIAYRLTEENGQLSYDRRIRFRYRGKVLAKLDNDGFLFERYHDRSTGEYATVHKIRLDRFNEQLLFERKKINRKNYAVYGWVTDSDNKLTLGVGRNEDDEPFIQRRKKRSSRWQTVWTGEKESLFKPLKVSDDGSYLWAFTDQGMDTISLIKFDLVNYNIAEVVYSRPQRDLTAIELSETGDKLIAVTWRDAGVTQYDYLSEQSAENYQAIREVLPESSIKLISGRQNMTKTLVQADTPEHKSEWYYCDTNKKNCEFITSRFTRRDRVSLARVNHLNVKSTDDLTIDAFLTLPTEPNDPKDIPLVVVPHGGPIGVLDTGGYDGEAQWLAANGYAVLKVNYRGSGGYGKAFQDKGLKSWGRGIEDDIEHAVVQALNQFKVINKDRVCIFGTSYGGYSALFSIIRSPDLYQCSVSFAGVTDLSLILNQFRHDYNKKTREWLIKAVGDPETEMENLKQYSPTYNYHKISTPLLLLHGTDDNVVDVEHSWRLHRLLTLRGFKHQWEVLEGFRHGWRDREELETFYDIVIPFLDQHLGPPVTLAEGETSQL